MSLTRKLVIKLNCILFSSFMLNACGGGNSNDLPEADKTPPVVVKTEPASGAEVSVNTFITITFNEAIQLPEAINVDVYKYNVDGSLNKTKPLPLSTTESALSLDSTTTILTIRTNADTANNKPFLSATKYQVNLRSIKDVKSNPMRTVCRFEFSTKGYNGNLTTEFGLCDLRESTQPPTVIANKISGNYNSEQLINLTCSTADSNNCDAIYYTLDGTNPTMSSLVYKTDGINITKLNASTILKYFGVDSFGVTSIVGSQTYLIDVLTPVTVIKPVGGNYNTTQSIELTCSDEAGLCDIYYTLDDSIPTSNSLKYSSPINISMSQKLRFLSIDSAGNMEPVQSQNYFITRTKPVTIAKPPSGDFSKPMSVILSCKSSGDSRCTNIYYTVDGTNPNISSPIYDLPINVSILNSITTLKYFSIDSAGNTEDIKVQVYKLDSIPPVTTIDTKAGNFVDLVTINLTCTDSLSGSGCKNIYYTVDGSIPTINSLLYTGAISIRSSTLLRYFSIDNANNDENNTINSQYYIISLTTIDTAIGPEGGIISSLFINSNSSKIFAGVTRNLLLTSAIISNTPKWVQSGVMDNMVHVKELIVDQKNESIMYALAQDYNFTGKKLYKSLDAGLTWNLILGPNNNPYVNSFVLDPIVPKTIYVGTDLVYKSVDGGVNYSAISERTLNSFTSIDRMWIIGTNTLIIRDFGNKLFERIRTFVYDPVIPIEFGNGNERVTSFELSKSNPSVVYLIVQSNGIHLYRSFNGQAGTKIKSNVNSGSSAPVLAIDPQNENIIYISNGRSIEKSIDAGANWNLLTSFNFGDILSITVDQVSSGTLYVGFAGAGIYRTINSGATWSEWNNGLNATNIIALEQEPITYKTLYAGVSGKGIFKKNQGSNIWTELTNYNKVFDTTNRLIDVGIIPQANNVNAVFVSTKRPGVDYTSDNGGTWNTALFKTLPVGAFSRKVVFNNLKPSILYASVDTNIASREMSARYIAKSEDGGLTWFDSSSGLPNSSKVIDGKSLTIDPVNPSNLFVIIGGSLFKSTDAGLFWSVVKLASTNVSYSNVLLNANNSLELLIVGEVLERSLDGGITWNIVSNTVAWSKIVNTTSILNTLKISPFNNNVIYAGTSIGLFRSLNSGKDWSPVLIKNIDSVNTIEFDYLNKSIYIGTTTGGVRTIKFPPL